MANRWAILIGINVYHESLGALNYCENDALLMQELLASEFCSFPKDNIVLLTDNQPKDRIPTFGNIHSWLGAWLSRPEEDDLVLVYFAGHGRDANGQAVLVPVDATLDSLPVTGISIQYLRDMLDRCKARQKVLILDACHSGAGRDVATMTSSFRQALDEGTGLYTIASCDADQISYEWPEKQHGVFTHYFNEAVRHGASVGVDGQVTLDRIYEWIAKNLQTWSANKRLKQEPVRICRTKGEIPIAQRHMTLDQQLISAQEQIKLGNETICRLRAETERLVEDKASLVQIIGEKNKITEDNSKKNVRILPAAVPEWSEWIKSKHLHIPPEIFVALVIVMVVSIIPIAGFQQAKSKVSGMPFSQTPIIWLIVILFGTAVIIILSIVVFWWCTTRNRYRAICAEVCLKDGDYVGGSAYACAIGRLGIDRSRVTSLLDRMGELADANGDTELARRLWQHSRKRWRSPYADQALRKLEKRSQPAN